ncbi:uncharacterised protein family FPL, partial [Kipferlia bialata]
VVSIEINQANLAFFFDRESFPLLSKALPFHNHQDTMVQIAVRTLSLCTFGQASHSSALHHYLATTVSWPYSSAWAWLLMLGYHEVDVLAASGVRPNHLRDKTLSLLDRIYYMGDLVGLKVPAVSQPFRHRLLSLVALPMLCAALGQMTRQAHVSHTAGEGTAEDPVDIDMIETHTHAQTEADLDGVPPPQDPPLSLDVALPIPYVAGADASADYDPLTPTYLSLPTSLLLVSHCIQFVNDPLVCLALTTCLLHPRPWTVTLESLTPAALADVALPPSTPITAAMAVSGDALEGYEMYCQKESGGEVGLGSVVLKQGQTLADIEVVAEEEEEEGGMDVETDEGERLEEKSSSAPPPPAPSSPSSPAPCYVSRICRESERLGYNPVLRCLMSPSSLSPASAGSDSLSYTLSLLLSTVVSCPHLAPEYLSQIGMATARDTQQHSLLLSLCDICNPDSDAEGVAPPEVHKLWMGEEALAAPLFVRPAVHDAQADRDDSEVEVVEGEGCVPSVTKELVYDTVQTDRVSESNNPLSDEAEGEGEVVDIEDTEGEPVVTTPVVTPTRDRGGHRHSPVSVAQTTQVDPLSPSVAQASTSPTQQPSLPCSPSRYRHSATARYAALSKLKHTSQTKPPLCPYTQAIPIRGLANGLIGDPSRASCREDHLRASCREDHLRYSAL